MTYSSSEPVNQAFALSRQLKEDRRWFTGFVAGYWAFCFRITRIYENIIPQQPRPEKTRFLNFGCGNRFQGEMVNSDLFAPHRFVKRKRRPDLFWSGTNRLKHFEDYFDGIVCEHVIEHILPDNVACLFSNFFRVLRPGGNLVVTFPDVRRVLENRGCQGYESSTVALNSLIYRHGHRFMYDADIVSGMLLNAGFKEIKAGALADMPNKALLDPGRETETSYIWARRPK